VVQIDDAIARVPLLEHCTRGTFVQYAVLYASDSISESYEVNPTVSNVPCDIESTQQINVSDTTTEFREYIHVAGEVSVPKQIVIFAATGGYKVWSNIHIPAVTLALTLEQRLMALLQLMKAYPQEHNGQCRFFGAVTGFLYVREFDYYEFDKDGPLGGHVDKPFCQGVVSVSVE
jgi:hypothetical protein